LPHQSAQQTAITTTLPATDSAAYAAAVSPAELATQSPADSAANQTAIAPTDSAADAAAVSPAERATQSPADSAANQTALAPTVTAAYPAAITTAIISAYPAAVWTTFQPADETTDGAALSSPNCSCSHWTANWTAFHATNQSTLSASDLRA
jgi:hypothetical protein